MFWIFFLLPAFIPVDANVDVKMRAVNVTRLEISFHVRGEITSQLNGHFEVEHNDCGAKKQCGETFDFKSVVIGDPIRIQTILDPCSNHTGIKIKAGKFEFNGGGVIVWTRDWNAVDCNDPQDTDTEVVTSPSQQDNNNNNNTKNFFTEKDFQNGGIILGIVLFAIIAIAVTLALLG